MPFQRSSQAAPSFLVELGNGDKFLFDIGLGLQNVYLLSRLHMII